MKRRSLLSWGSTALLGPALASAAQPPHEGLHYVRLAVPQPPRPGLRAEVVEFFWYGCGACYALEPQLNAWLARKPADIGFQRTPALIRKVSEVHQRLFYALEALGQGERLHGSLFTALQQQGQTLASLEQAQRHCASHGVPPQALAQAWDSFAVLSRCRQAQAQAERHQVQGVPWLSVNGRWATSPALAGGPAQAVAVLEHLITLPS